MELPDDLRSKGVKQFQYNPKRLVSIERFNQKNMKLTDYFKAKTEQFYAMHNQCPHGIVKKEGWALPQEKDTKGFWFIEDDVIGFELEADLTWYMMKYGTQD